MNRDRCSLIWFTLHNKAIFISKHQLDNQVDAFIVQAAPGRDTIDMLREIRVQKPMLLVANDALREKEEDHISKYSDLPALDHS